MNGISLDWGLLLSVIGALVGMGVGWGVVKSTVKDLREEVSKLSDMRKTVYTLESTLSNLGERTLNHGTKIDYLVLKVHDMELTLARSGLSDERK